MQHFELIDQKKKKKSTDKKKEKMEKKVKMIATEDYEVVLV